MECSCGARSRPILFTVLLATVGILASAPASTSSASGEPANSTISDEWLDAATTVLRQMEYRFAEHTDGVWSASNRSHGMRVRIGMTNVQLEQRSPAVGEAAWRIGLSLTGYGRGEWMRPVPPASRISLTPALGRKPERLELDRGVLVEWYSNDHDGLEQGFSIHLAPHRPESNEPVILELSLTGETRARMIEGGRAALLSAGGRDILRYAGLSVVDADGHRVPAELVIGADAIRILVHDGKARYPIEVDPYFTSVAWSVLGGDGHELGWSVSTAGDVNADGFSDVLIGVPSWTTGTAPPGAAFVYMGSPAGLPVTPDWQATGAPAYVPNFGWSVSTAGDVNADGYDDILVGAPDYGNGGAAFMWLGGPAGLGADGTPSNADWSYIESQSGAKFGWSVARAGDVDGDGDDDVLVGAPQYTNDDLNEGRVFLFLGVSSGLATLPAWTAESDQSCGDIFCAQAQFGRSVDGAGDLNGDGFADIVVGSPRFENGTAWEGAVFVWYGYAGLPSGPDGRPTNASWYAESGQDYAAFGESVAGVGDVNGDGFADLLVGGGDLDGPTVAQAGAAYLWMGGPTGLGAIGSPANADWSASSDQNGDRFGASVATAGDVNGDGFSDLIIGAPAFHDSGFLLGAAFLWLGGPAGPGPAGTVSNADWAAQGSSQSDLGYAVRTAGDVDGDGFSDFLIGAPRQDGPGGETDNGRVALYLGHGDGLASWILPVPLTWSAAGGQSGDAFGTSVAAAGDVNGDGFSDVLVGAPDFDDGETEEGKSFLFLGSPGGLYLTPSWNASSNQALAHLGESVAGVHDLNGDGYDDIAIGAPDYEKSFGNEGAVFVWLGGPATGPDPAGMGPNGTPANADWSFLSGVTGARLGSRVAPAGDVNADGLADLIVSAPDYTNGEALEGRVWVFAGAASGTPTLFWSVEPDTVGWRYGDSVASAGDVNGDGFGDIVLGMPYAEIGPADEGVMLVFHGGAATMGTVAFGHTSGQADAHLGQAVAAGDINGDGYSDLVVGAPDYDASFTDEGKLWLFPGSATGVGFPEIWTALGDIAGARLGASLAPAGDLNRDGFEDIVSGMPAFGAGGSAGEGAAAVWLGGPAGPGSTGTWLLNDGRLEGNQAGAALGTSVAPAGDVNGDGFGDLLVGVPGYDGTLPDEGDARVWYGNAGFDGLHIAPRQARSDDSALIGLFGRSDAALSFRVRAVGRSPAGRTEVRLQWEVKPLGTPFDGIVIQSAPTATDTGAPDFINGSAVDLSEEVAGLAAGTFYHWRARIASTSPLFPRTPWFSLSGNSWNATDLRTDGCVDRDGDGYGAPPEPSCLGGIVLDCDDTNSSVSPAAVEACNGVDDNCDGSIDEGDPGGGVDCSTGLKGVCALGTTSCQAGSLICLQTTFPTMEICDGLDNDCDGVVPPDEMDADGDGLSTCAGDCNDADFGSIATPEDVTGVVIAPMPASYRLTWDSQDLTAGRGTVYDIFSGMLSLALPSGDLSGGTCLTENVAGIETYDETTPDPPTGEIRYFILRGQNTCPVGTGTYGTKNRDSTAGLSPSACN